ncbi:MAG: hypothetical protein F6J90_24110 [Moorea sp. SIOASIH]|uniref:hypothetical protein n=1 Tax=Moorena sp. SIOASIH TaxID=2607817 RepID=UPI0013B858D6|nr:hypothetical protein [Moorena sp. SIOASIH]NEO39252.1 hypothetical protein [Moorena sp. SIOASIH]
MILAPETLTRPTPTPLSDSQFPTPDSRFPTPYSLLPTPYSLLPISFIFTVDLLVTVRAIPS